ncbi:unnamed protein product [Discosporangium mesarthrocarpum]
MEGSTFFETLSASFRAYHQNSTNVLLHLLTTPLGIFGACCLAYRSSNRSVGAVGMLAAVYVLSLADTTPLELVIAGSVIMSLLVAFARIADLSLVWSLALVAISYVAQDAAHYITGEPTYQGSYTTEHSVSSVGNATDWLATFTEHTLYLLPLTLDAAVPFSADGTRSIPYLTTPEWVISLKFNAYWILPLIVWVVGCFALDSDSGLAPWQFVKRRVLTVNLDTTELRADLAAIRKWASDQNPSRDTTTHWWFSDLGPKEAQSFERISSSAKVDDMFRQKFSREGYVVAPIRGMDEVYVSAPAKKLSSDTVFLTKHTDGPWALVPFCSTFRCIVGMDSSGVYTTKFPNVPYQITCRQGDVVAFDYNREIHFIEPTCGTEEERSKLKPQDGGDGYRMVLKLHYCMYPRMLWPLGKLAASLSLNYNTLFRNLFLGTIAPSGVISYVGAFLVVNVTKLYHVAIQVGYHNMLYVAAASLVGLAVDYRVFLVATSFVHYLRYIETYYHRDNCNFGTFKSDVLFYKTVALAHIAVLYRAACLEQLGEESPKTLLLGASIGMVVVGYAVCILASLALGVDGTYFGAELGICGWKRVTTFPYGTIPHPMITGQLFAMAGMYLLPMFRAEYPWLIPVHGALYITHMLQEEFDVWKGVSRFTATSSTPPKEGKMD